MAEIQLPDGSFTTSYPAAFTVKDKDTSLDANRWYLTFGSGPTGLDGESNQNVKIFAFDLDEIANPSDTAVTTPPSGCVQQNLVLVEK